MSDSDQIYLNKLDPNKIYKGHYIIDNKEYFSFFKVDNFYQWKATDVLTGDFQSVSNFYVIYNQLNHKEFNFYRKLYNIRKDKSIFKVKSAEEEVKNVEFFNLLRFFNLETHTLLFEEKSTPENIDLVVSKIQRYTKRYIGEEASLIYAEQLKKYDSIYQILTLLPIDLLDITTPFWVFEINEHHIEEIVEFNVCYIEQMKNCNKYNFKIRDVWHQKSIIQDKIDEIIELDKIKHKEKYLNVLQGKINEAVDILLKEKSEAQKTNDNELLEEIEIIQDEFKEIEKFVYGGNVDFEGDPFEWWPALLYPVIDLVKINSTTDLKLLDSMFEYDMINM